MTFAAPIWLAGTGLAALLALVLVLAAGRGAAWRASATRPAGGAAHLRSLPAARLEGGAAWVATALAFVAGWRPQYGRGTRLIPPPTSMW